jgi:hypothetical protein
MEKIRWTDCVRNEVNIELTRTNIAYLQSKEGTLTRMVISFVRTVFYNTLLKERQKGREDEEEDISSYWMILRKSEDAIN